MSYKKYNDYELLYMVRENDENSKNCLLEKYYPIIKNISLFYYNKYIGFGYDLDDFIQEALLAFYRAIDTFDESRDVLFYTYLCVCIHRKFSSFCRIFTTNKNISNTYFASLDDYQVADESVNIYKTMEFNDTCNRLRQVLLDLTFEESCIYELKINNFKYKEIALLLDNDIRNVQSKYNKVSKIINNKLANY